MEEADSSIVLGANIESAILDGVANINATGNELNNYLLGTSGNNLLDCGLGGDDTLIGGGGDDALLGAEGRDTLIGGSDNDTLNGSAGADKMLGGAVNDSYIVDVTTDVITENLGEGIDTVQTGITYTLGGNVETSP